MKDWQDKFKGEEFYAAPVCHRLLNAMFRGLEVEITQSNPRGSYTVPTWHVFYLGVRIFAIDVNKTGLLCRFLKLKYTPKELLSHHLLNVEQWNKSNTANMSVNDIDIANGLRPLISDHLKIIENALNGAHSYLPKPRLDIKWLKEMYFETQVQDSLDSIEEGLTLVKRQVVIPAGRIDLLCSDSNNMPVVLELKAGNGDNSVIRQIKNYIDCIEKETGLKTKGIIVIQNPNPELESDASQNGIRTFVWKRTKTKKTGK